MDDLEPSGQPLKDLSAILEARRLEINVALDRALAGHVAASEEYGPRGHEIAGLLREFVTAGGKRIRGALALEGYRAVRGDPIPATILHAALALEILHAFLLIHDDVIDQDDLRRGKETFHKRYRSVLEARGVLDDAPRLADGMAMLAGDLLCALAHDELVRVDVEPQALRSAQRLFHKLILDTGYGEILDVLGGLDPEQSTESVLRMYRLKTARYSFEGPLLLGALLAGATVDQRRALSAYGIPLGIAFQLRDDVIGIFGTESEVGKPIGSDLKEGKRTPLVLHALRHGDDRQRRLIESVLGDRDLTAEGVAQAAGAIRATGALDSIDALASSYVAEARRAIVEGPVRPESRQFLDSLATVLAGRKS